MDYWAHLREQYARQYESAVEFPGHIPLAEVLSRMMDCDVYCSASLGEGSSMARGMALCLGVPVVTTNCGEAADLARDVSHVRLADPMDADGYQAQLQAMCQDSLANCVTVCGQSVAEWRRVLEPAIEMSRWAEALRTLPAR
jgi:glycosyltransferase involved in cell wall biosynthesis